MKWILIVLLIFAQFLSLSQTGEHEIIVQTDKEVYQVGETIKIDVKSKRFFRLMTTGDCSSAIMSPSYIKEVDGEWKELEARRQMCCGLPYSSPMKELDYEMMIGLTGRYKIVIFAYEGQVTSNIIEIKNK